MTSLQLSFNAADATGRGCVFVFHERKKSETYLRIKVSNPTSANAGLARVFLTRLEYVDAKNRRALLCDDTLPLNWALSSGADLHFFGGYEHYCDLLQFRSGQKFWEPMLTRCPTPLLKTLSAPGIYRLHLLLTGPAIKPATAIFELRWPLKKLSSSSFSFSLV